MNCIKTETGIKVLNIYDLDLDQTLDCGQSFRWVKTENGYKGVAFEKVVTINLIDNTLYIHNTNSDDFNNIWKKYLDLELDYGKIREDIGKIHPVLKEASEYAPGIRILQQDSWEALCTFIISQNNNIKRIKGIVEKLCILFGKEIEKGYYSFPSPQVLSKLNPEDLDPIKAGFRNKYIIDAAKKVASKEVDLKKCREMDYEEARLYLQKIKGVGVKVADCTLLFGFHRVEAFPVDVWMKKAMEKLFKDMTPQDFGKYAGIAQQYIFHYSRMHPELF